MNTFLRVVIAVTLLAALGGCGAPPTLGPVGAADLGTTARSQVESAFAQWNAATGRGDLASVMEKFDGGDAIMLIGSDKGEVFQGRQQIEGWLRKLFASNRFSWEVKQMEIDVPESNVATIFIEGTMRISDPHGKIKGETPYRITGALIRRADQWKWRLWSGAIPAGE